MLYGAPLLTHWLADQLFELSVTVSVPLETLADEIVPEA